MSQFGHIDLHYKQGTTGIEVQAINGVEELLTILVCSIKENESTSNWRYEYSALQCGSKFL